MSTNDRFGPHPVSAADCPTPNFLAKDPACAPATAGRRHFLTALLGALGLALVPWRRAEAKKVGLRLGQLPPLAHVGGTATVKVKGQEIMLVRDAAGSVKAINPMCTHKACKVFYKKESNDLACKCHKSKFTLAGKVMGGPAPRPLQTFPASLHGEQIVIDLP